MCIPGVPPKTSHLDVFLHCDDTESIKGYYSTGNTILDLIFLVSQLKKIFMWDTLYTNQCCEKDGIGGPRQFRSSQAE